MVQGSDLPFFTPECGYNYAWEEYYLCKTHLDGSAHEQTFICGQLFAGHMVGSRPMKKKKKKDASNNININWQNIIYTFCLE